MRKIAFQEVGMENYGPFTDPMVLGISSGRMTLITGRNGVGKTMSIEAIPFTLYGMTTKGARGDDVVNNKVQRDCHTWVKFIADDIPYEIHRFYKHRKLQNTVHVIENGKVIKKGHRESIPFIENLLWPYQVFVNTTLFGQMMKDFFTDLVDSKKKEVFRRFLNLEKYVVYQKVAADRLKEIQAQITQVQNEIEVCHGIISNTQNEIEHLLLRKKEFESAKEEQIRRKQSEINDLQQQKKDLEARRSELEKEAENIGFSPEALREVTSRLEMLETEANYQKSKIENDVSEKLREVSNEAHDHLTKYQESFEKKKEEILADLQDAQDAYESKRRALDEDRTQIKMEIVKKQGELKAVKERITEICERILDAETPRCSLCDQEIDHETRELLTEKVRQYEPKIDEIEKEIESMNASLVDIDSRMKELQSKFQEEKKEIEKRKTALIQDANEKKKQISDMLEKVQSQINARKMEMLAEVDKKIAVERTDLEQRKKELDEQRNRVEKVKFDLERIEPDINALETRIKVAATELEEIRNRQFDEEPIFRAWSTIEKKQTELRIFQTTLVEKTLYAQQTEFWKNAFSPNGIPSRLIDEAIPFLNQRVHHYLELLTNGRYIISFSTLGETKSGELRDRITLNFLDTYTRADKQINLSGGQTRIIDIAVFLSFNDLVSHFQNVSTNLMMFDEIFDALDEENIGYVANVLNVLKKDYALFVISHVYPNTLEPDVTLSF